MNIGDRKRCEIVLAAIGTIFAAAVLAGVLVWCRSSAAAVSVGELYLHPGERIKVSGYYYNDPDLGPLVAEQQNEDSAYARIDVTEILSVPEGAAIDVVGIAVYDNRNKEWVILVRRASDIYQALSPPNRGRERTNCCSLGVQALACLYAH